ncbi:MAG: hypothetical protein [Wendovervirus sonii]|uniref:Tail fiber protein n=1 Tax=phage Lak_Megaphage_Sonny TaxID=3109229 RepID=A0ABZ0Z5W4_9CAUD|nr:MAG: hypothetical protein [phage Lak_Megaphage_Sonny]
MTYYSVLNDIIDKPRSNEDLIQSIIMKASSIVTEYGEDYIMEHNIGHYFDVDNNEIVKLSFTPIIDTTATNVYKAVDWYDYILYNYTKNTYTIFVSNADKKNLNDDSSVSIDKLTNKQLTALNKSLCNCTELCKKHKAILNKFNDKIKDKKYIIIESYMGPHIIYITGTPYIDDENKIAIPCRGIYTFKNSSKLHANNYNFMSININDIDNIAILNYEQLLDRICDYVKPEDMSESYYNDINTELKKKIKKCKEDISKFEKKIDDTLSKTDKLKIQLKIAENEEAIEKYEKQIKEAAISVNEIDGKMAELRKNIDKQLKLLNWA